MTPGRVDTVRTRPRLPAWEPAAIAVAAALVILSTLPSVDAPMVYAGILLVLIYVGAVAGFLRVPHVAVAGTVVLFALIPSLKVFTGGWVGALKDLVVVAAATAAVLVCVF